jgi:hypothetical protein
MPASTPFSGRPEKVNPAVPPPAVAVPVELLVRCLRMSELLVTAAIMESETESVKAALRLRDDLAAVLDHHRPT